MKPAVAEIAVPSLSPSIVQTLPPWVSASASALALGCAFPPVEWGWLAWIALAPFFSLIVSDRRPLNLYLSAWLGGLIFWLSAIYWVTYADATATTGWLVMGTALSVFWPIFLWLSRLAVRRAGVSAWLVAPTVWVGLEYARAYYCTGFPWYYLAHSQYALLPLIQIAELTGALGLSFIVALANACFAEALVGLSATIPAPGQNSSLRGRINLNARLVPWIVLAVLLAGSLVFGAVRLLHSEFSQGLRVALLQTDFRQHYDSHAARTPETILETFRRLVSKAINAAEDQRPDLIVWPETSFPYYIPIIGPETNDEALAQGLRQIRDATPPSQFRKEAPGIQALPQSWADQAKTPMIVGASIFDFQPEGLRKYNGALLFSPGGQSFQSYRKIHLVPFGEYVPLIKTFSWLISLTPYRGTHVPSLSFGEQPQWFDVNGIAIATPICFEDTVPQLVRRLIAEAPPDRPTGLLINLSNEGWFRGSSEHQTHLAASVFRTVEHRVPMVRAVNTGISAVIDGDGRILDFAPPAVEQVLIARVPLDPRQSLYTQWGDWLGELALGLALVWPLWPGLRRAAGRLRSPSKKSEVES